MARDNTMPSVTVSSLSEIKGATKRQEKLIAYALKDLTIGFRFSWQTYRHIITRVCYLSCIREWRVDYVTYVWDKRTGNFECSVAGLVYYAPRKF